MVSIQESRVHSAVTLSAARPFTPRSVSLPNGFALMPDKVTFASTIKSKPDIQKLVEQTDQEALHLFSKNTTKADLQAALKAAYQDSNYHLEIYDGAVKGQEWVNQVCMLNDAAAFFQVPDSTLYGPKQASKASLDTAAKPKTEPQSEMPKTGLWATLSRTFQLLGFQQPAASRFPEIYENTIYPALEQPSSDGKRKVAIYISKNVNLGILKHEAYHALGFKNGLPWGTNPDADTKALAFRDRQSSGLLYLHHRNTLINALICTPLNIGINTPWQLLKIGFNWGIKVPYLGLKRLFTGKLNNTDAGDPEKANAGEALRINMAREKEVDRFFLVKGKAAGIPRSHRFMHIWHYLFESKLQDLLSHQLG